MSPALKAKLPDILKIGAILVTLGAAWGSTQVKLQETVSQARFEKDSIARDYKDSLLLQRIDTRFRDLKRCVKNHAFCDE